VGHAGGGRARWSAAGGDERDEPVEELRPGDGEDCLGERRGHDGNPVSSSLSFGSRPSDPRTPDPDPRPRPSTLGPRTSDLGPRTLDLEPRTSDLDPRSSIPTTGVQVNDRPIPLGRRVLPAFYFRIRSPRTRSQFDRRVGHALSDGSPKARPTPCGPFSKMCISAGTLAFTSAR
jgi:hypothetical protein